MSPGGESAEEIGRPVKRSRADDEKVKDLEGELYSQLHEAR
jgi:hypothetical protein